jgi:beta-N-acetylhexosaminidase
VGGFMITTRAGPQGVQRGEARATSWLINELQKRAKVPLIFGADLERGLAMRVDGGTSFPQAMAVGATGDPDAAYVVGRITALEARAIGIQWIFAPVADVNSNPENPIINIRSFGEDPARVAEFVAAFVRGVQENGALACAKHFPGHGDTHADSHLEMPMVSADRARLERVELVPFGAAISAGVASVMTGHLAVPAIETDAKLPATLSKRVMTDLLRGELGFEGVAITDAMDMAGVTAAFAPGDAAVRAIAAGADVALMSPDPAAALAGLEAAVAGGQLSIERVEEAVTRILRAKATVGLNESRFVEWASQGEQLARPQYLETASEMAERGVTLLRDEENLIPLRARDGKRVLFVAVAGDADATPAAAMEHELRERCDLAAGIKCDTKYATAASVSLPDEESYDFAIVALLVRVADRKGSVSLPAEQAALVEELLGGKKPVIIAAFGSPYVIERFPAARTWLAGFSTTDVVQRALVRALFGETAIAGYLPVSIPGARPPLRIGDGIRRAAAASPLSAEHKIVRALSSAGRVLESAIRDRAFPGAVLAIVFEGRTAFAPFGKQTYDAGATPVAEQTIFDLASLTKAVVTATLVAQEVEPGKMNFDAPVAAYLPEWLGHERSTARQSVTIRHLLTHTSGLPAHVDFFKLAKSKSEIIARSLREPLEYEPGTKSLYSDLDFMILGEILERITGKPLDLLAQERIFAPLGMRNSVFNPTRDLRARVAPTEHDATFRKRLVHGEVHDENAFAMGGVAGHAGLFSTAGDLAIFARAMLNRGSIGSQRILRPATVSEITKAQPLSGNTRTLGWMVPTENSSSGRYFSKSSYGHTGFTGTSLWIDPEKDLAVILLTNRVYPTRENDKITAVRPAVHDAIVESLGLNR